MKRIICLLIFIVISSIAYTQTSEPILRLDTEMHTAMIKRISTDSEGKYLLTASYDKTAKLWDASTGELIRTLRPPIGHGMEGMLYAGAISPDGQIVAVGGWTGCEWDQTNSIYIFRTTTGELLQGLTGLGNVIFDLEFSADDKFLAAALGGGEGIVIYKTNLPYLQDLVDLNITHHKTLTGYSDKPYNLAFASDGRLATVCFDGYIRLYDLHFNLKEKTTGAGNQPYSLAFSPDGSKIAVGYSDAPEIEVFDGHSLNRLYQPELNGMNKDGGFASVCFSSDGSYLYGGGYYREYRDGNWWLMIRRWSNAGRGSYTDYPACYNAVMDIKALPDGDILFGGAQPDFGRLDAAGEKIYYRSGELYNFRAKDRTHFKINRRGDEIAFKPLGKEALHFSVNNRRLTDFNSQSGLSQYSDREGNIRITDWEDSYKPHINGEQADFLRQYERCRSTDVAPDGNRAVLGTDWYIYCTNAVGEKVWETPVQGAAWTVNISENGRLIASAQDGVISWYSMNSYNIEKQFGIAYIIEGSLAEKSGLKVDDIILSVNNQTFNNDKSFLNFIKGKKQYNFEIKRDGKIINININKTSNKFGFIPLIRQKRELLTLYVHPETQKWLLYTPSGYYDAAPGAERYFGWHLNQGAEQEAYFFPSSKFRNKYYRPDVIDNILVTLDEDEALRIANLETNRRKNTTQIEQMLPPVVNILKPYHNQEVRSPTVTVEYTAKSPGGEQISNVKFMIDGRPVENQRGLKLVGSKNIPRKTLTIPKHDVTIQILAKNQHGWSTPAEVKLKWTGQKMRPKDLLKPTLYVLAIGVSDYQNNELDLQYAARDASDFSTIIKQQKGGLYKDVKVTTLTNHEAKKNSILDGLNWIQKETTSRDLAMIFLAGHGINDNIGSFYYLPHEAKLDNLRRTGLMFTEFKYTTSAIAGKVVMFVDACHSGDVMGSRRAPDVNLLVNELSDVESGAVVFTSSTGKQFSLEDSRWQNGAFTEALVEGFTGKADLFGKGKITIKALDAYIAERVKELTDGKQAPTVVIPQSMPDFPIGMVK